MYGLLDSSYEDNLFINLLLYFSFLLAGFGSIELYISLVYGGFNLFKLTGEGIIHQFEVLCEMHG